MSSLSPEALDLELDGLRLDGVRTLGELVREPTLLAFVRHHG